MCGRPARVQEQADGGLHIGSDSGNGKGTDLPQILVEVPGVGNRM